MRPAQATDALGPAASRQTPDSSAKLQLQATAVALMDPDVVSAMQAAGGVAVAAVLWGDSAWGAQAINWRLISNRRDACLFAASLLRRPRQVAGNTDLTDDIDFAGYYASHVILGEGFFVITVASYASFAAALERKLLREVEGPSAPMMVGVSRESADPAYSRVPDSISDPGLPA